MRRGDELYAAFRNRPGCHRLRFGADLIDDDYLRHVVLHRLDHHRVLGARHRHLHAPRLSDAGMRHVAVAGDFVGRVDNHHSLVHFVGKHACGLAKQGCLADPGTPEKQHRLAAVDHVAQDVNRAEKRPPDPARQTHKGAGAVAYGRDAVQGALDAGAVVLSEGADVSRDMVQVLTHDLGLRQRFLVIREPRLRKAAQVEDDLQQVLPLRVALQSQPDTHGHDVHQ